MDKQKIYAFLMKTVYVILTFLFGGALFYYFITGQKHVLWVICGIFVLYSIWHILEFRREFRQKSLSTDIDYRKIRLPDSVDDFAVPRYVYENGVECKQPNPKNGRIVGYRIGASLVIAAQTSKIHDRWKRTDVPEYISLHGGKLLNHDEANTLRHYWDRIDEMREAVNDNPLPVPYFWYQTEFSIEAGHYREDLNEIEPTCSAIILKL